jgi:hypothetical protein
MGRVAVIGRTLSSNAPRMWAMLRSPEMKGTLSHLPQRAPSKSEDRGITVGLAGGRLQDVDCTEQQLHHKLFQAPGDQDRTGQDVALSIEFRYNATAGCKAESWRFFKQHLLPTSTCNPCVYQTRTPIAVDQWPAQNSAAVSRPVVVALVGAGSADESG